MWSSLHVKFHPAMGLVGLVVRVPRLPAAPALLGTGWATASTLGTRMLAIIGLGSAINQHMYWDPDHVLAFSGEASTTVTSQDNWELAGSRTLRSSTQSGAGERGISGSIGSVGCSPSSTTTGYWGHSRLLGTPSASSPSSCAAIPT